MDSEDVVLALSLWVLLTVVTVDLANEAEVFRASNFAGQRDRARLRNLHGLNHAV